MVKRKNLSKGIVIAALAIGVVGAAVAFFSARAITKENAFKVFTGEEDEDGGIEIMEPKWDAWVKGTRAHKTVSPGSTLDKDPYVQSHVNYDGWVIMKVTVPNVLSKLKGQDTEVMNPVVESINNLNVGENKDFIALDSYDQDDKTVYFYGYKALLPAQGHTTNLFESITVNKFTKLTAKNENGEALSEKEMEVDVDARLMQAIDEDTGKQYTSIQEVWETVYKGGSDTDDFGKVDKEVAEMSCGTLTLTGNNYDKRISMIRIYKTDDESYEDYTSFADIPVYAGGKVVLYQNAQLPWRYLNKNNNVIVVSYNDEACSFTVPSNASGSATLFLSCGQSNYIYYHTNSTGWVADEACYPVSGE